MLPLILFILQIPFGPAALWHGGAKVLYSTPIMV